jgi:hypothetical protein
MTAKKWTHDARKKAGRRMVSIWLTKEQGVDLDRLSEAWGIVGVRDVIATALRTCVRLEDEQDD